MSEYEQMLDNGTWKGGYVKDDAGDVTYAMGGEATCNGYSGCGSGSDEGSDFEFSDGSYNWHEPDSGSDDDGKGSTGNGGGNGNDGGTGTGTGGNTGGGTGGGGSYQSDVSYVNNGKQGTFLYKAKFYTEKEYNQMCKNGTWRGGNIFTLGYVGSDFVITSGLTPIDPDDGWLSFDGSLVTQARNEIVDIANEIMSLPYVRAIGRYYSATGAPLYFDVKSLGIENLAGCEFRGGKNNDPQITCNLLDLKNLEVLLSGKSAAEKARIINTAITLGNIRLTRVADYTYKVEHDTYNFDMHKWTDEPWRNVATIIGGAVSEGLSIGIDYTIGRLIGIPACTSFSVAGGLARRHIYGKTSFDIYISGEVKTK